MKTSYHLREPETLYCRTDMGREETEERNIVEPGATFAGKSPILSLREKHSCCLANFQLYTEC